MHQLVLIKRTEQLIGSGAGSVLRRCLRLHFFGAMMGEVVL
jgi:hypothetical protein